MSEEKKKAPAKKAASKEIDIVQMSVQRITYYLVGRMPLWCNRVSEKAKRQLLLPSGRKTAAEKKSSMKHNPLEEFRASPYFNDNPEAPTLIRMPAPAFKKAMSGAALDIPGTTKSQIGRLLWVMGEYVDIYGVPELGMSVVRSADMNKTPDIRTRAVIPNWCASITVEFVTPALKAQAVSNLLVAAGITQGIGDWRNEKGSGTYGSFEVVAQDDERVLEIMNNAGRERQIEAMRQPEFYDEESGELYLWWFKEAKARGFEISELAGMRPAISRPGDDEVLEQEIAEAEERRKGLAAVEEKTKKKRSKKNGEDNAAEGGASA